MRNCSNPECLKLLNTNSDLYCQSCGNLLILLRNRYRPVKLLGQGGFARTYLAKDQDRLNELCVIKQFCPDFQERQILAIARSLFEKEAQQLQKLGEHPQIPTLYAYFEEHNQLYLVQQYISGVTLEQKLAKQGIFTEEEVLKVLQEILNILDFIHTKKVIHRDIKPANIICYNNQIYEPNSLVLIDFGIAKQTTHIVTNTRGTMVGSHGYVPIEQMESGQANSSSDLYSLGVTCFHLLSNVNPWELWKLQGYGWTKHWKDHLIYPISTQLERILDKLLNSEADQRYETAKEVLNDFSEKFIKDRKTSGSPHFNNSISTLKTVVISPKINTKIQTNQTSINSRSNLTRKFLPLILKHFQSPQKTLILISIVLSGLTLVILFSPKIELLCNALNNCSITQHFQELYTNSERKAEQAIQKIHSSTSQKNLEKSRSILNNSIAILDTIPKNIFISDEVEKKIEIYQQQLALLDILIQKGQKSTIQKQVEQQVQSDKTAIINTPKDPPLSMRRNAVKTINQRPILQNIQKSNISIPKKIRAAKTRLTRQKKEIASTNSLITKNNRRSMRPKKIKSTTPLWEKNTSNNTSNNEPLW